MKKLLSVIITLSASCFMGICQNYIEIDLTGKHIHTRSLTDAPEASISNDILTVSFDGSGMYSLYIEDSFGVTVYSSALPANGMEYDYDSYFTKMKELVPSKTQELNILYHSNKVRRSHERNSSSGIPPVPTTSE